MNNYPNFYNYGYQIIKELGHNRAGGRVTYLATEINTQKTVVVKQFQLTKLGATWAEYDGDEQKIKVLKTLHYPAIPKYRNFRLSNSSDRLSCCYSNTPNLLIIQTYQNILSIQKI
ncbi:MAG: hypothetical protein F6K22_24535 [Okeania sp. SIO2F4]|uniref:hypothetical protein n=1 Tax=Okeania sp. SIO2F4 TaxID=2607790 RepID=UPI00142CB314|nr:hypothetical protein [Okeania sp. SIO2F4]NES05699.1 hypothetical protein [Okeania sp. SIO2F4]